MNMIQRAGIALIAVAIALAGATDAFAKGKKNKGDKEHHIRGKITAVDGKTVTVETRKHGSQTFQIADGTVFEKGSKTGEVKKIKGKKLKVGKKVSASVKAGVASKVTLGKKHHKGGKKSDSSTSSTQK